jgi:hypothetical protein
VLILTAPLAARFLPLALMVIAAPLLAPVHLTPVLPLLAGLWASPTRRDAPGAVGGWGTAEAAVCGGLVALWLKVCAGLSGGPADLWPINGWSPAFAPLYERLHTANSLQTLVYVAAPLISGPTGHPAGNVATALLFNVLQVLAWTGAAMAVAAVRDVLLSRNMGRAGQGGAWTSMLSLVPGLGLIWAGYVVVPSWLQVPGARWLDPKWLPVQVVLVGFVAVGVDGLLRYLQQPLYARQPAVRVSVPSAGQDGAGRNASSQQRRRAKRTKRGNRQQRASNDVPAGAVRREPRFLGENGATAARSSVRESMSQESRAGGESHASVHSKRRRDVEDDIIMIELD